MKTKTIKELVREMSHRMVTNDELDDAREYERSLLMPVLAVPKKDEIYLATQDIEVSVMVQFSALFSSGSTCIIPASTKIKVGEVHGKRPPVITCAPVEYNEMGLLIIRREDRENNQYTGYCLSINVNEFGSGFILAQGE